MMMICVNNPKLSSASLLFSETVGREPLLQPPCIRHRSEKWPLLSSAYRNVSSVDGSHFWDLLEAILSYPEEGVQFLSSLEASTSNQSHALPSSQTQSLCLWTEHHFHSVDNLPFRRKRSRSRRSCWTKYHCWGKSCCRHLSNSVSACGAVPVEPQTHPGVWIHFALPCGMHAEWHWGPFQLLLERTAKRGCWVSWGVYSGDDGRLAPCWEEKKKHYSRQWLILHIILDQLFFLLVLCHDLSLDLECVSDVSWNISQYI